MDPNKMGSPPEAGMTIGQLARAAGVNIETVRYYQRIGLVVEPEKPAQGFRRYSLPTVERIRFIKRAQELGFSLSEITDLLSLDELACDEAREIAEHKRQVIQQRINDLNAMQCELTRLIEACRQNTVGQRRCAIIGSLKSSAKFDNV